MIISPAASWWFDNFLSKYWLTVLVAGVFYVVMSVRVALQVKKIGHNPVIWFFITLFFTAIPAGCLFLWHSFGWLIRRQGQPGTGSNADNCK